MTNETISGVKLLPKKVCRFRHVNGFNDKTLFICCYPNGDTVLFLNDGKTRKVAHIDYAQCLEQVREKTWEQISFKVAQASALKQDKKRGVSLKRISSTRRELIAQAAIDAEFYIDVNGFVRVRDAILGKLLIALCDLECRKIKK